MKDYYVVLTGTKNNAGDYLIRNRAFNLLREFRSDRDLVNYDGWKKPDEKQLATINNSKGLLLTGGPGLQQDMASVVFALSEVLERINVPIITYGIGWKSAKGHWEDTRLYPFTGKTEALLRRIDSSGYISSVRDEHSLNALMRNGYSKFIMTGCPVLYLPEKIGSKIQIQYPPRRISFSPGVCFATSTSQEKLSKDLIINLQKEFPKAEISIVFHHSLALEEQNQAYNNPNLQFLEKNRSLANWAKTNGFQVIDISGGVEKMISHYQKCDLHIGYRVHAHLLMSSISRFSVLLSEDGRGRGQHRVLGGLVFDCAIPITLTIFKKIMRKTKLYKPDMHQAPAELAAEIMEHIRYEYRTEFPHIRMVRTSIDTLFPIMRNFLQQLP